MTLHHGYKEGLLVALCASGIAGLFALATLSTFAPAWIFLLEYWLPLWLMGWMLCRTGSINWTLQAVALFAGVIVLGMHVFIGDIVAWWREFLEFNIFTILKQAGIHVEVDDIDSVAALMTGIMTLGILFLMFSSLFLARSWQAALYNPGGFKKEFSEIHFSRRIALFAVALLGMVFLLPSQLANVGSDLFWIIIALSVLQGLAVMHFIFDRYKTHSYVIFLFYISFLFFLPQLMIMIATLGYLDIWLNFRPKIALSSNSNK